MEWIYNKKLWWVVSAGLVAALAAFIIGYNIGDAHGYATKKTKIDGKLTTYNELVSKIAGKKNELQETKAKKKQAQGEYAQAAADLGGKQNQLSELKTLKKNRDQIVKKVESSKDTLSDLKSQISDAKNKLATVTAGVQKANGAPITLGAGRFVVGEDIPAGRYKAVPVVGNENFVTYDMDGDIDVNTILGSESDGLNASYVFSVLPTYTIETGAKTKFIPVK